MKTWLGNQHSAFHWSQDHSTHPDPETHTRPAWKKCHRRFGLFSLLHGFKPTGEEYVLDAKRSIYRSSMLCSHSLASLSIGKYSLSEFFTLLQGIFKETLHQIITAIVVGLPFELSNFLLQAK